MKNVNINTIGRCAIVAGLLVGAQLQAAEGDFSLSTSAAVFTGVVATAAALVGAIVALSGGMDAYRKIRGFFNRAK